MSSGYGFPSLFNSGGTIVVSFGCALEVIGSLDIPTAARPDMLAVAAMVLPLYECIGRFGCHFAGCCHGIPMASLERKSPLLCSGLHKWQRLTTVSYFSPSTTAIRNFPHLKGKKTISRIACASNRSCCIYRRLLIFCFVVLGRWDIREAGAAFLIIHATI